MTTHVPVREMVEVFESLGTPGQKRTMSLKNMTDLFIEDNCPLSPDGVRSFESLQRIHSVQSVCHGDYTTVHSISLIARVESKVIDESPMRALIMTPHRSRGLNCVDDEDFLIDSPFKEIETQEDDSALNLHDSCKENLNESQGNRSPSRSSPMKIMSPILSSPESSAPSSPSTKPQAVFKQRLPSRPIENKLSNFPVQYAEDRVEQSNYTRSSSEQSVLSQATDNSRHQQQGNRSEMFSPSRGVASFSHQTSSFVRAEHKQAIISQHIQAVQSVDNSVLTDCSNPTNSSNLMNPMLSGSLASQSIQFSYSAQSQSTLSVNLMKDAEDCRKLQQFLIEEVQCTEAFAIQYSNMLIKNGVPNVQVLRRRLLRNGEFLLDIGFDEYTADDVAEIVLSEGFSVSLDFSSPPPEKCYALTPKSSIRRRDSATSRCSGVSMRSGGTRLLLEDQPDRDDGTLVSRMSSLVSAGASYSSSKKNYQMRLNSLYNFEESPLEVAELYAKTLNNTQENYWHLQRLSRWSNAGNPLASGFLMRIYALGLAGQQKDLEKANFLAEFILPWLTEIISETELIPNCLHAMYSKYLLGVCYAEGLGGTKRNQKEAFIWFKLSADQGYDAAQAYVAHCYHTGSGVNKDLVEAFRWYKASASQGFASAQCNLGICLEFGEGTDVDVFEAVKLYKLAAEQGNAVGQYNYALCLELGKGLAIDCAASIRFYQRAAEQHHPIAQFSMGMMYFNGYGAIAQDADEAFRWIEKSAAQKYAKAQCYLGMCYEKGIGCEVNAELALKFYQLAVDQGDASAMYYLGYCYFHGIGCEDGGPNYERAIHFYKMAAEKGQMAAANNLGYCCFSGIGVRKNFAHAVYWYKLAAEQGYPPAQYNLAYCYEKGVGVAKRQQEMLKWYKKAAEGGHPKAIEAVLRFSC